MRATHGVADGSLTVAAVMDDYIAFLESSLKDRRVTRSYRIEAFIRPALGTQVDRLTSKCSTNGVMRWPRASASAHSCWRGKQNYRDIDADQRRNDVGAQPRTGH